MNINFYYQPYKEGRYWSNKTQSYYHSTSIGDQVWKHKDVPCTGELLDLHTIVKKLPKNVEKTKRSLVHRFESTEFPLKERIGYDKWNGIVFIDLDMIHSSIYLEYIEAVLDENEILTSFNEEKNKAFYDKLSNILANILPDNFYMIEHSSSKIGLHMMFYYDCEKTEDNFFKCAQFTKNTLMYKISDNSYDTIPDFSEMICEPEVFDDIWSRPYQKCFITGIDLYINEFISGEIDLNSLKYEKKEKPALSYNTNVSYEISSVKLSDRKMFDTHHNDRFYLYTALKRVTKDEEELNKYWAELCKHFKLYKSYTYKKFLNEFNYRDIKEDTAYLGILKRYGINIDKSKAYINLEENEYLGNKMEEILSLIKIGITLMRAPTGSGKTKCWIDLNEMILSALMNISFRPILVIEPLNSIIDTKYDKSKVDCVFGNKHFPKQFTAYSMYVTNYNKLLKKDSEGNYKIREDIDEFLAKFCLVIIDESHVIIKDAFRCDVLIPFIESINKAAKSTKILLQTATPMDEEKMFDINTYIEVYKKPAKYTKYIFRRCIDNKFNIQDITCLVQYYISSCNKKVYVYWNNASLTQLNSFRSTFENPDKVAIYHKRNIGDTSMNRISKYHVLDTKYYDGNRDMMFEEYSYDVLLSSVYFGVGNDLDDRQDAAVIIIGNNTWQEDIQAIGRWRNSKNIEVCQIILPNEYEFVEFSANNDINRGTCLSNSKNKLDRLWHDKLSKDKSVIINHKTYMIEKDSDIKYLSIMQSAEDYYSSLKVKVKAFKDKYYDIDVREDYNKPLECNYDYTEANKQYWKSIKDIRDKQKKEIIKGNIEYDDINKDTKLGKWYRLWRNLENHDLVKRLGADYICNSNNLNMLSCWYEYYIKLNNRSIDYPELYSLIWYRDKISNTDNEDELKLLGVELSPKEYYSILAYIIFVHNKNKEDKDFNIKSFYYTSFRFNCKMFSRMNDKLIDILYNLNHSVDGTPTKLFFGDDWKADDEFEENVINSIDDILGQTKHINKELYQIENIIRMCINTKIISNKDNGKIGGKIGGKISSPKKKIRILESFKNREKYNLEVGQLFESCSELAQYTNKSNQSVSNWMSKKWIESV